jgi:hypothetical protein
MSELPTLQIDPQAWIEGFRDAYTGLPSRPVASVGNDLAYASGRVEGEALRLKHRQEYEQLLFSGRRTRELPQAGPATRE